MTTLRAIRIDFHITFIVTELIIEEKLDCGQIELLTLPSDLVNLDEIQLESIASDIINDQRSSPSKRAAK